MTIRTRIPNLSQASAAFDASETAVGIDTKDLGALAQVSGGAMGFDVFTPTANATYYLILRGQDAASGAPTNGFVDVLIVLGAATVTWTVLSSTTVVGTPGARTYCNNFGVLNLAVATGTTWYVDMTLLRFPA